MVDGDVRLRWGVSITTFRLFWIFKRVPLDRVSNLDSSSNVLKFYIIYDLSVESKTNKCILSGQLKLDLAIFYTIPYYHLPWIDSPKKYRKSTEFGLKIFTIASLNLEQYCFISIDFIETGPNTISPVWGHYSKFFILVSILILKIVGLYLNTSYITF